MMELDAEGVESNPSIDRSKEREIEMDRKKQGAHVRVDAAGWAKEWVNPS